MYIIITKIGLLAVLVCVLDILVPYFVFKYKILFRLIEINIECKNFLIYWN